MALQYAGADIDWNGYCIPNYLYGLYITDQYESFHWSNYEFIGLSNYSRALLKADLVSLEHCLQHYFGPH